MIILSYFENVSCIILTQANPAQPSIIPAKPNVPVISYALDKFFFIANLLLSYKGNCFFSEYKASFLLVLRYLPILIVLFHYRMPRLFKGV